MFRPFMCHPQVLNEFQVLEGCAHIWDPSSVYILRSLMSFKS